jgi:PAS domain S-box-containing protein
MTLRRKTMLLSGIVLMGLVVFIFLGSILLSDVRIGGAAYSSIRNNQKALEKIAYLKSDFNQIRVEYLSTIDENSLEQRKQRLKTISNLNENIDQSFAEIRTLIPENHHKALNDAKDEWKVFTDNMSSKIIPVILEGNRELAVERIQSIQKHRYNRFVANLDSLITSLDQISDRSELAAESMVKDRTREMAYTSILILLIIVTLVLIVSVEFKTEKERAEQYLRIAEVILVAIDEDSRITLLNRKGHEVLGYNEGELIGKNWLKICVPVEEHGNISANFNSILKGASDNHEYFEHYVLNKNGERRLIAWHNTVTKDKMGRATGVLGSGEDITELRKAEAESIKMQALLAQSQKMETIGRLAGGIAHDFNNKLTVIIGYAQLFDMLNCHSDRECGKYLDEILKAGQHAQEMTQRLLSFSRNNDVMPISLNLNSALHDVKNTLGRMLGEQICFDIGVQHDLWPVHIDATQFDQIITNLVVNARDAISQCGKITVNASNTTIEDTYDVVPIGDYVIISCVDDGCGIDDETLKHIFEPFFTTKEVGKGTGLGLYGVYGIVKQNNGHITIQSKPGEGSNFSIYLPRYRNTEINVPSEIPSTEVEGFGTILLVEDEEPVRKMTKLMLETLGYNVLAPETTVGAITLCRDPQIIVHCVLSDVIMPEMNGLELKHQINAIRPDLPFVFMSGYTSISINKKLELVEDLQFIKKPLDFRLLNHKLNLIIGNNGHLTDSSTLEYTDI